MLDLSKTAIEEMPSSIGCLTNLTTLTLRFCINLVRLPSTICSLKSLNSLDLSDCNLLSIPNDIGCLSSLEYLNLSRNNFDSLPESMSQLYNFLGLYLEGCKRLQSLENVPLTIDSVIANDCTLLGRFPKLQFYPFRSDHSHLNFQCLNCFKLVDYIQSDSSMFQVSLSLSLSLLALNFMFVYFRDKVVDYQAC